MNIINKIIPLLFITMLCTKCDDNDHLPKAYAIGVEHDLNVIKIKLENDKIEEQFIFYYTEIDDDGSTNYFSFTLYDETTCEYIRNSKEFTYNDNLNSNIEFNEDGYFEFYGSRIFYISYKNASEEIKTVIQNKKCSITASGYKFSFPEKMNLCSVISCEKRNDKR